MTRLHPPLPLPQTLKCASLPLEFCNSRYADLYTREKLSAQIKLPEETIKVWPRWFSSNTSTALTKRLRPSANRSHCLFLPKVWFSNRRAKWRREAKHRSDTHGELDALVAASLRLNLTWQFFVHICTWRGRSKTHRWRLNMLGRGERISISTGRKELQRVALCHTLQLLRLNVSYSRWKKDKWRTEIHFWRLHEFMILGSLVH